MPESDKPVNSREETMNGRSIRVVLGLLVVATTAAGSAASEPQATAGNLGFQVTLRQSGPFTLPCLGVPDFLAPPTTACIPFTGTGSVRGLGNVAVTDTALFEVGLPVCPGDFAKQLDSAARLRVAGKGEIFFAFAQGARCVAAWWLSEPQEFTITGGTGPFAGASGTGTRERSIVAGAPAIETWTGTIEVPGLVFDVTAPKLHGAGSRTVRAPKGAKSARVTFDVTATDDGDGAVPVSCRPRSGSRFRIGRTTVRCDASDSSGNAAKGAFTVTVKERAVR
jgi:hypothetical protein